MTGIDTNQRQGAQLVEQEQIQQARQWLTECVWEDIDDDDINEMSDSHIVSGIARHYSGGIEQFIEDGT